MRGEPAQVTEEGFGLGAVGVLGVGGRVNGVIVLPVLVALQAGPGGGHKVALVAIVLGRGAVITLWKNSMLECLGILLM